MRKSDMPYYRNAGLLPAKPMKPSMPSMPEAPSASAMISQVKSQMPDARKLVSTGIQTAKDAVAAARNAAPQAKTMVAGKMKTQYSRGPKLTGTAKERFVKSRTTPVGRMRKPRAPRAPRSY